MSLNHVHSSLHGIAAFDREEQFRLTGWKVPDYSSDRVSAPRNREAFLDSFYRRYVTENHWHILAMMKSLMLDCITLVTQFHRNEVVQHVQPRFINSTRPNKMHREPTPHSRGDIRASLSHAVSTCTNRGIGNSENVVVVERGGRQVHVSGEPDALTYYDLITTGLQYLKENNGICKSGKALFDLVFGRCWNFQMYCPWSKCDLFEVFKRECARITLMLSTTRTMTGHNEGLIALLFLNFRRGLNEKIEHSGSAGSNDKTTVLRPSSIYLNTLHEGISHMLYKLIMKGHKFCYEKWAEWYSRLFVLRELEIDDLQEIVDTTGANVSTCPVETTPKATLVLTILTNELGNTEPAASSSSAGASSSHTFSGTSSSGTSGRARRQSLESRRKEINTSLYRVSESPFTHSLMSDMVTTIVEPSPREQELDQVVALVSVDTLCTIFHLNAWSVSFAECLNEAIEDEDMSILGIELFRSEEFVGDYGSEGELTVAAIEIRIEVLKDWSSSTQITLYTWMTRAHIHRRQYCSNSEYLVPRSGGSLLGFTTGDYAFLRNWLYCIIRDPQFPPGTCFGSFGEVPEPGSPECQLLIDIGVCYDPALFRTLVGEQTDEIAETNAKDNEKKRKLGDAKQSQADAAASILLAKFGGGGVGGG